MINVAVAIIAWVSLGWATWLIRRDGFAASFGQRFPFMVITMACGTVAAVRLGVFG